MRFKYLYIIGFAGMFLMACGNEPKQPKPTLFKGLYSFGPEIKSFQECGSNYENWVVDSSAQLELRYSQLGFEKPYEPVYVEVEGIRTLSPKEGIGSDFDSTLTVYKLIKITRDIPQEGCLE